MKKIPGLKLISINRMEEPYLPQCIESQGWQWASSAQVFAKPKPKPKPKPAGFLSPKP